MSLKEGAPSVGKGAAYLYIEMLLSLGFGYIFWVIVSKITSPHIIGSASAVVSFATILATVSGFGLSAGIQRYLAKDFQEYELSNLRNTIGKSLKLLLLGCGITTLAVLLLSDSIYHLFQINIDFLILSLILMISTAVGDLFHSIIISSLKTKSLPLIAAISTSLKFLISLMLLQLLDPSFGLVIGFLSYPIVSSVMMARITFKIFNSSNLRLHKTSLSYGYRELFNAGAIFWVPLLINTIGSQLGTIIVYGAHGALQAGFYFLAFSITNGLLLIVSVLMLISRPAMSTMDDGRKRFAWKVIKFGLIASLPISFSLIFYAQPIMALFGEGYTEGALSLQILLLTVLPMAVINGITSLTYVYGNNREVLFVGLGTSVPRTVLYFILVPLIGANGAAIAFLAGGLTGLVCSAIIARKLKINIPTKSLIPIAAIPAAMSAILAYFGIHFLLGLVITIVGTLFIFIRLNILPKKDIQDISSLLPNSFTNHTQKALNLIYRLYGKGYGNSN